MNDSRKLTDAIFDVIVITNIGSCYIVIFIKENLQQFLTQRTLLPGGTTEIRVDFRIYGSTKEHLDTDTLRQEYPSKE